MMEIQEYSAGFYHIFFNSFILSISFAIGSHFFCCRNFSIRFVFAFRHIFFSLFDMSHIDWHFFSVILTQISISNSRWMKIIHFFLRSHHFVRCLRISSRHSIIIASEKSVCMVWKFKISRCKHIGHIAYFAVFRKCGWKEQRRRWLRRRSRRRQFCQCAHNIIM